MKQAWVNSSRKTAGLSLRAIYHSADRTWGGCGLRWSERLRGTWAGVSGRCVLWRRGFSARTQRKAARESLPPRPAPGSGPRVASAPGYETPATYFGNQSQIPDKIPTLKRGDSLNHSAVIYYIAQQWLDNVDVLFASKYVRKHSVAWFVALACCKSLMLAKH